MSDLLLQVKNISVVINDKIILDDVSFDMPKAKIITVIGPNGSGKTTLVRCILNLIKANKGKIIRKKNLKIGYMPQKLDLNPNLPITVLEFLKLKIQYNIAADLLKDTIAEIGIDNIINKPLQNISGGEMQRVLLARSLLCNPDLLVLDEPVQGVDVTGQVEFYQLIDRLRLEKSISILVISHDLHVVMKSTNYVICLNQHICCEGPATLVNQQEKFKQLFGNKALEALSMYEHHHNHDHNH